MSFIVVDSGSSKTDWVLVNDQKEMLQCKTRGLNPSYYSQDQLEGFMQDELTDNWRALNVQNLFFYGTGCSGEERTTKMFSALRQVFTNVVSIEVNHDLFGAGRACLKDKEGLIGILGTGSSIGYFDGKKTESILPSLGYLLGDEGGGVDLGKTLLIRYLYKELSPFLMKAFEEKFKLSPQEIIVNVNKSEAPHRLIASFSPFLFEHKEDAEINQIIKGCFHSFFNQHVCKYNNHQNVSLNFVGSIAYVYQEFIKEVAEGYKVKIGNILQAPIDELLNYHLEQYN